MVQIACQTAPDLTVSVHTVLLWCVHYTPVHTVAPRVLQLSYLTEILQKNGKKMAKKMPVNTVTGIG